MPDTLPLLEVLRGAESYLAGRGVESPRLNAEHLLAHVLGLKRMELYLQFDRPLGEAERAPLREMIKRRGAREPLQHILGTVEFHGRTFLCDKRALVPRPETEQLVEIALRIAKDRGARKVLDVGTGSGVIAITMALEIPDADVRATDISAEALSLAAENAARHGVSARVVFSAADLLPDEDTAPDLVVANLPYIPSAEIAALPGEVRHDPVTALDGGADGLDIIRRLVDAAGQRLSPGGAILMEIGAGQADAVGALMNQRKLRDISVQTDYQNIPRFALGFHG
ncbi:MAG: peptide chain release factor N(5)-glutamine methyltransferase [Chthoniobacterales bacterium]|nr:peptide chain release factor N(5)-glutamine methyltransferase [Chthoniobacterales bacterium]